MRTFEQLTQSEQQKAVDHFLNQILQAVCEGGIRFDDGANGDSLQATIDEAIQKAEDMRTPWFAHEYVMDARYSEDSDGTVWTVADILRGMARTDAEDSLYAEEDEHAVHRIVGAA